MELDTNTQNDAKNRAALRAKSRVNSLLFAIAGFLVGFVLIWQSCGCGTLGEKGTIPKCATGGVAFAIVGAIIGAVIGARRK